MFSVLKNALTKLIRKDQCIRSYLLRIVSISVRNKTDTPKIDEPTTNKQPKRSKKRLLLEMDAVPILAFGASA
jgi:hypothetical protein